MSVLSSRVLQEQLSLIMGALTKAAVLEICELVTEGYATLQREIDRRHQENDDLRKKLHLIESIVVRGSSGGQAEGNPEVTPSVAEAPSTKAPQSARDGEADGGGRVQELPDVVLIKDEDSDDDIEEEKTSAEGATARERNASTMNSWSVRRVQPGKEDAERKSSPEQIKPSTATAGTQKMIVSYTLGSSLPESPGCSRRLAVDVGRDAVESACSLSSQMDSDIQLIQECSIARSNSERQMFFRGNLAVDSQTEEVDVNVDPTWTKQPKISMSYNQFHQTDNMDGDAFGLKLISVSGSTSTDCHLSEGSNSTFEYDEGDMMNFALYSDQSGPAQQCEGQPGFKKKRFICSICNKTYATAQNRDVHMRLHTGQKPFACSQCGKKFTQSSHLKGHMSVHTGERPFVCSICSKSFIVKYSLKLHMKNCHPPPGP
ncbi:zinc finger protein 35-like [Gouania willdenowi]|uniref:zinc finger protein 35-like n=1 Tax=Gouania willdenowi TaxID=441366 RepID=UPI0010552AEA|nr:zinc finger protein 35-like [Gouania willdenowi]